MGHNSILAIFLVASLGLTPALAQPSNAVQAVAAPQAPAGPCPPPNSNARSSGFRAVITCEWHTPAAIPYVLKAFKYYIDEGPANVNMALKELLLGDKSAAAEDICRAAFGVDKEGHQSASGVTGVLLTIATANTSNTQEMSNDQKDLIFKRVTLLINKIFHDHEHGGAEALAEINTLFRRSDDFRALYRLLKALPEDSNPDQYIKDLETLRVAFAIGPRRLAAAVEN